MSNFHCGRRGNSRGTLPLKPLSLGLHHRVPNQWYFMFTENTIKSVGSYNLTFDLKKIIQNAFSMLVDVPLKLAFLTPQPLF